MSSALPVPSRLSAPSAARAAIAGHDFESPHKVVSDVASIAAEALVASIAVERNRYVAACHLGEVEARNRGLIREGLSVMPC